MSDQGKQKRRKAGKINVPPGRKAGPPVVRWADEVSPVSRMKPGETYELWDQLPIPREGIDGDALQLLKEEVAYRGTASFYGEADNNLFHTILIFAKRRGTIDGEYKGSLEIPFAEFARVYFDRPPTGADRKNLQQLIAKHTQGDRKHILWKLPGQSSDEVARYKFHPAFEIEYIEKKIPGQDKTTLSASIVVYPPALVQLRDIEEKRHYTAIPDRAFHALAEARQNRLGYGKNKKGNKRGTDAGANLLRLLSSWTNQGEKTFDKRELLKILTPQYMGQPGKQRRVKMAEREMVEAIKDLMEDACPLIIRHQERGNKRGGTDIIFTLNKNWAAEIAER